MAAPKPKPWPDNTSNRICIENWPGIAQVIALPNYSSSAYLINTIVIRK